MAFTVAIASDVTASTLEKFNNPKDPKEILQRCANKPLLRILMADKMEFDAAGPAVNTTAPPNFREPVQGALMRDQAGFYAGIAGADVLAFKSSDGAIQTSCPVRWMHAGMQITHDELAYQGVIVTNNKASEPTNDDQVKLFNALQVKKADYQESILYARDVTLHADGSQDAKAIAGIFSILTDDPTTGTVLGISRSNTWWRHVADTGVGGAGAKLSYSKSDQTLTERLIKVFGVILPTYGGFTAPRCVAGSDLIDMLRRELRAKGQVTVDGWTDKYTNVEVQGVRFGRVNVEFDPSLDLQGRSKRIIAWDADHLKLRPQKGQWGKVTAQNQPADQFVMLTSTTDRGTLSCNQMDCNYVGDAN